MLPTAARNAIADAFWALLEQKSLDAITVSDIAKARAITRQAFYYHFQSLLDVLTYAIGRYVTDLTDRIIAQQDPLDSVALAFSPAIEHQDVMIQLAHSKKYPVHQIIQEAVMDNTARLLMEGRVTRNLGYDATEMAVRFYSGALLNVLDGACKQEYVHAGYMAEQFYRFLYGDLLPPKKA